MKSFRNVFTISILVLLFSCRPAEVTEPVAELEADNQIIIGQMEKFDSAILEEERDLWIYVPNSADDPANADRKYPVMYLLDGNAHFHSVTGIVQKLGAARDTNSIAPEMVVVAIPNTDRLRDLTPTHVEDRGTSGGGDDFLDFIEHELIPYIEGEYPVSDYRTFVGHSLGGLMVIDALVTRPQVFDNYLAIDPSLWWDDQAILRKAEAALVERNFTGKGLYVAVANTMNEGMSINQVVDDEDESTLHIRSILQFSDTAEREASNGLQFGWDYYPDDNHGSVTLVAEYDAMRFLFSWHYLDGIRQFASPDSTATPDELLDLVAAHYAKLSERFGYPVEPPEQFANSLGHNFLANEKPELAYALFDMNMQNYPRSAVVYDAMGDYYAAQEDADQSRDYFSKAIAMGSSSSQEKLDKLAVGD